MIDFKISTGTAGNSGIMERFDDLPNHNIKVFQSENIQNILLLIAGCKTNSTNTRQLKLWALGFTATASENYDMPLVKNRVAGNACLQWQKVLIFL